MSHSVQKFNQNNQPFQEHSTFSGKYYLVWSQADLMRIQKLLHIEYHQQKNLFLDRSLILVVDGTGDAPRVENGKAS